MEDVDGFTLAAENALWIYLPTFLCWGLGKLPVFLFQG